MSYYLARLKEIESGKNFSNSLITEVSKVPKAPFDTFDTSIQAEIEKNILVIQLWLFQIGEPEEDHYLVLDKCKNDPEVLQYFLRHARGQYESDNP